MSHKLTIYLDTDNGLQWVADVTADSFRVAAGRAFFIDNPAARGLKHAIAPGGGEDYQEAQFVLEVDGKRYRGCTLDIEGAETGIDFLRVENVAG